MSETLLDKTKRMIEALKEGKFVEGMEEFYADDAVNEEVTGAKIEGKANIIANEKKILANVKAYHGIEIKAMAGGPDDGKGNGVRDASDGADFAESVQQKFNLFNPAGIPLRATLSVTFAEYKLTVDMNDGSTFNPDQVQVTRWRDGKAHHIKFYYDPSKL